MFRSNMPSNGILLHLARENWLCKISVGVTLVLVLVYGCFYPQSLDSNIGYYYSRGELQNAYFVNQPGCQIAALPLVSPEVLDFLEKSPAIYCKQRTWFRTRVHQGMWSLHLLLRLPHLEKMYDVDASKIYCNYSSMERQTDRTNFENFAQSFRLPLSSPVRIPMISNVSLIRLACYGEDNRLLHKDVHFFVQPPPAEGLSELPQPLRKWPTANRSESEQQQQPPPQPAANETLVSVMILVIDTLSHMNFLRQMPLTAKYLRTELPHVEFWGYNKVGRSTYANLVPLLSGLSAMEFTNLNLDSSYVYFDNTSLLWNHFKRAGYNTSLGEDATHMSLFNYRRSGFKQPPTDHYLRPTLLEVDAYVHEYSNYRYVHCSAGRSCGDLLLDHIGQLLPHMQRHPFFSFYRWSQGVHRVFNFAHKLDKRFHYLFKRLHKAGITNNTLILFMSDHGLRWGDYQRTYQGFLEDAQPLLYALYPDWLEQLYPQALANLQKNAHSLITTYDLHATLLHLLQPGELQEQRIAQRSADLQQQSQLTQPVSLFLPVPPLRNCQMAKIPEEFCLCHKLVELPVDNKQAKLAAQVIVRSINKLLEPYRQCYQQQLDTVLSAHHTDIERHVRSEESTSELKLKLQTQPGRLQFEATTRFIGFSMALTGGIVPLDNYRNQSECIDNKEIEPYCYCI